MYVKNLQLINFRNYDELNIELSDGANIFIGDNAQGKTNIIESIYLLSTGKSHRSQKDNELISWNSEDSKVSISYEKESQDKSSTAKRHRHHQH